MNSDLYDSAAWRTFDMLDAEESAIFDEAMRHDPVLQSAYLEMDRLSAAIAITQTPPVKPTPEQVLRLQTRLGLIPPQRSHFWPTFSGWAAAAVLAVLLTLHLTGIIDRIDLGIPGLSATSPPPPDSATTHDILSNRTTRNLQQPSTPDGHLPITGTPGGGNKPENKASAKVETKRLNQETEVLRDHLENVPNHDRALFEVVPGMALPIIMTMAPPGVAASDPAFFAKNDDHSPITTMLGDALTALTGPSGGKSVVPPAGQADRPSSLHKLPTAVPIYDAARDIGTLVVSNLPPAAEGEAYNLWVSTATGGQPIYVGSLPESSASGADSFDFSLGSTMVLPSGFILTKDPQDTPASPSETNTVLQGPPSPPR